MSRILAECNLANFYLAHQFSGSLEPLFQQEMLYDLLLCNNEIKHKNYEPNEGLAIIKRCQEWLAQIKILSNAKIIHNIFLI